MHIGALLSSDIGNGIGVAQVRVYVKRKHT